jgi:hypothetical protein
MGTKKKSRAGLASLKRIRALLTPLDAWTTGVYARTVKGGAGHDIGPREKAATCWCLTGAICKVQRINGPDIVRTSSYKELMETILGRSRTPAQITGCPVVWFNDHRSHPAVLRLLDDTIARLEG